MNPNLEKRRHASAPGTSTGTTSMRSGRAALDAQLNGILRNLLDGRRVAIIAPRFDGFFEPVIRQLAEYGAHLAGVLAWQSDSAFARRVGVSVFELEGGCASETQFLEHLLTDLPDRVRVWIEAIDPSGDLIFLGNQFVEAAAIAGRPVFGWRRPGWAALEDKTLVGANAAVASLDAPDNVVVPCVGEHASSLNRCCAHLDRGYGVVVSVDAGRPDLGGSSNNAYFPSPVGWSAVEAAVPEWAERIRVSSFVPGIPCSINGVVLGPGRTMVFDPIEIVTLLDIERSRLLFCGSSTRLRPPAPLFEAARAAARSVAISIAASVDFRGGFSIDGLLADDRFYVTEVNARPASGIGLRHAWPSFPFFLFTRALMEVPAAFEALPIERLETTIREAIRNRPSHAVSIPTRTIARIPGVGSDGYVGDIIARMASREVGRPFVDGLAAARR